MKHLPSIGLTLALFATPVAAQNVDIFVNPPVFGLGDSGTVTVIGQPNHVAIMFTSLTLGPSMLPIVGELAVGLTDIDYVVLGVLPASGAAQFTCTLPCPVVGFVHMQAVTLSRPGGGALALTGKSDLLSLLVDGTIIDDCDDNGIDDDCEAITDCNGNNIPDVCDIDSGASMDSDNDGIPDECCPTICGMQARFTFDGPLLALPLLLTIHIVAPGVPAAAQNEITVLILSTMGLPMSVSSPNGAMTAGEFAFTPTGGFTFVLDYHPATPEDFGASIVMVGELEGHCERIAISSGLRSRCVLMEGGVYPSTNQPGQIEILMIDECR